MPTSDTSEKGLELILVRALTGLSPDQVLAPNAAAVAESPAPYGGAGYVLGSPADYDRDHAVDLAQLLAFLRATQPDTLAQ